MSEQIEQTAISKSDAEIRKLRRALPSDLHPIIELENEAFAQDRIAPRSFARLIRSPSASVVVSVDGKRIEGCAVVLFRSYSRRCRLYSLAVAQSARGKGIGGALLAWVERDAEERGCEAIGLEVRADNATAIQLYRRKGFEHLGETAGYYSDGAIALHLCKALQGMIAQ